MTNLSELAGLDRRKFRLVRMTPELMIQTLGFPADTVLVGIGTQRDIRVPEGVVMILVYHPDFPLLAEGEGWPSITPTFRQIYDMHPDFVDWGL